MHAREIREKINWKMKEKRKIKGRDNIHQ